MWRSDPRFANRIVVDVAGTDRTVVLTTLRLNGNGDFRSMESMAFLDMSDIVCTNPPFSLFREYVAQIVEHGKGFLIVGPANALTYKEIFPIIQRNGMWIGRTAPKKFIIPADTERKGASVDERGRRVASFGNIYWYTNLDHPKRHCPLDLFRRYTPERYPEYDNYAAINVDKVADIPEDYMGPMGVPISFLDKWCPEQFEILDANDCRKPAEREREREKLCQRGTRKSAANASTFECSSDIQGSTQTPWSNQRQGLCDRRTREVRADAYPPYYPGVKLYVHGRSVYSRIIIRRVKRLYESK